MRITTETLTGDIYQIEKFYDRDRNFNTFLISGRLATAPEVKTFDNGARQLRYLVTTRTDNPTARVDVIPVSVYVPYGEELPENLGEPGMVFTTEASVQRRFWESPDGRRSRIEIIAQDVTLSKMVLKEEVTI